MQKVKLPREVAEAVCYFSENVAVEYWEQAILKVAMEDVRYIGNPDHCSAIKEYVKSIDNLRTFLSAIVNGYEVEETPEEQAIQWLIKRTCLKPGYSEHNIVMGIKSILERGVNDHAKG